MTEARERTPSPENKVEKTDENPECSVSMEKEKFVDSMKTFKVTSAEPSKNNKPIVLPKVTQPKFQN